MMPAGGPFRLVCCPNLAGEIVEWNGFAVLTWSLAGFAFAFRTKANDDENRMADQVDRRFEQVARHIRLRSEDFAKRMPRAGASPPTDVGARSAKPPGTPPRTVRSGRACPAGAVSASPR